MVFGWWGLFNLDQFNNVLQSGPWIGKFRVIRVVCFLMGVGICLPCCDLFWGGPQFCFFFSFGALFGVSFLGSNVYLFL